MKVKCYKICSDTKHNQNRIMRGWPKSTYTEDLLIRQRLTLNNNNNNNS